MDEVGNLNGWLKARGGITLCRLPASGGRPNSNRRESESARNGGIRVPNSVTLSLTDSLSPCKKAPTAMCDRGLRFEVMPDLLIRIR